MLSNKRLVIICAGLFCVNIALVTLFVLKFRPQESCYITIDAHQTGLHILPVNFLSVGIDTSKLQNGKKIPFNNTKFINLARALSPARLRLGGTMSERLIFSKDNFLSLSCADCSHHLTSSACIIVKDLCKKKLFPSKFLPYFLMHAREWKIINNFCKETNLRLLFSLNVLLRNGSSWFSENAKDLIGYSKQRNYKLDWQLGNEPNSYKHTFNVTLTPKQLAHDFKMLRKILNEYGYSQSLLVGPDTTRPQAKRPECLKYMEEFLSNTSHSISARSWHQYYLNSRTANMTNFWDPETFDFLKAEIDEMNRHTAKYKAIPMWLSETSSSYGGGTPGLSDSFAGTPLWLDKLGLSAKHNISTVIRQSLYGGNYSLIDDDLNPLPDWWVSILFKKVVGRKVLNVDCECSKYQRFYAHCANSDYTDDKSAITLYGMNLEFATVRLNINGSAIQGDNLLIDEFIVRAPSNNRKSKVVSLNGIRLYYDTAMPKLMPRVLKYGNRITLPPFSVGFWVIRNTTLNVCH